MKGKVNFSIYLYIVIEENINWWTSQSNQKVKFQTLECKFAIDKKINWLFNENITFGNIFVESESLIIFTFVICMPARWEVSNNSVYWMSSFSDAVNINKYSDLHFSYNFYRTKVRSLSCHANITHHSLHTWMMKKCTQYY